MAKVKILVDSSTDIPASIAKDLGIGVIPMPVTVDGKPHLEGVDLFTDGFYPHFAEFRELPKTSQPNLQDLVTHYREAAADGSSVVAIHLSSGLSGTVQTAFLAKSMLEDEAEIAVIDSLGASLGSGLLAIRAAEVANAGKDFASIVSAVEEDKLHMRYIFTPDTLEYLIKGGRVSKVSGTVGTLLDIKPLLHVNPEGKLEAYGKVRGRKPSLRKLAETLAEEIVDAENQVIGIAHAMCAEDAAILADEINTRVNVKDILVGEIGCTIGSHTGPGCISLYYRR